MKTLNAVWKSTLMMVLVSLTGALYAAILIPFKLLPIIPGVTEIRPANAIPIVCSLLFGPAGAWGSAIGNTVGDFAFGLGPGTIIGFVGNFLFGFAPYALWRAILGPVEPDARKVSHWAMLVFVSLVASAACAFTIAWGIDVIIKGVPFAILGTIIFFNNFLMAVLLGPALLFALLPRVRAWGLLYTTILPEAVVRRPRFALLGAVLFTVGSVGGLGVGEAVATGVYNQPVSVPWFLKQVREIASPVSATPAADSAGVKAPAGKPAPAAKAPAKPSASPSAVPAKPSTVAGLGWGLSPFLLLIVLGLLLL